MKDVVAEGGVQVVEKVGEAMAGEVVEVVGGREDELEGVGVAFRFFDAQAGEKTVREATFPTQIGKVASTDEAAKFFVAAVADEESGVMHESHEAT